MFWTLPTSSRFWSDRPTSRGCFHKLSLDLTSLTFYQPMVGFSGHLYHFYIANQLAFSVIFANFRRWFLQTESGYDLSNVLPTYGRVFGSFWPLALDVRPWISCPHITPKCNPRWYIMSCVMNKGFYGWLIRWTLSLTYSTPLFCQHWGLS